MEMETAIMESLIYMDYDEKVQIDLDTLIVAAWNRYMEYNGGRANEIFFNDKEFFEQKFNNAYEAAWAASFSDRWDWHDRFVYFNEEGYITSFNHWDDENSPIDLDKIDISSLINGLNSLEDMQTNKKGQDNNISSAIHDALKEV